MELKGSLPCSQQPALTPWNRVFLETLTVAQRPGHGTSPRYPLYRKLRGPQSRSGSCEEKKNLLPLPGSEPRFLGRPARSPGAIRAELPPLPRHGLLQE
jgi:hypothetical protein